MIKNMKALNDRVILERRWQRYGERIAWEVYIKDELGNLKSHGIIVQRDNRWYPKIVGWQQFSVKFWIGFNKYEKIVVAFKRDDVIKQLTGLE